MPRRPTSDPGPGGVSQVTDKGRRRFVWALLALPLALLSLSDTLAQAVARADPQRAHALAPWNGVIAARLAEREFSITPSASTDSRPYRLAQLALRQDATAAGALNVIGMTAQARRDTTAARAAFAHALTLSRRELPARIWAIEEAVARGDIRQALANYDVALKTSRSATDLLFPVLGTAIAEPRIRSELLRVLSSNPVWKPALVKYLATSGKNPLATLALLREGGEALPVDAEDRVNLVNALLAKGDVAAAWTYYRTFRDGAQRTRSNDPRFAVRIAHRSRFDWNLAETPGISASLQATASDGGIDFAIAPGAGGPIVEQALYLPPGQYLLTTRAEEVGSAATDLQTRPYWKLACSNGKELARLSLVSPESATVSFTVSPACPWQSLQLVARSPSGFSGIQGRVRQASVVPAARGEP